MRYGAIFGPVPDWYKLALIIFLILNPLIFIISPFVAGWLLVAEFIFTLAMALKCYPLLLVVCWLSKRYSSA